MLDMALSIQRTGLVTSVGLSAPATCAAIRAKVTNPTPTRFLDANRMWMTACQVPLSRPLQGVAKLAHMAALAIEECLAGVPKANWFKLPVLLCVAERDRPGRLAQLSTDLLPEIERIVGASFAKESVLIEHGRVSVAVALDHARKLVHQGGAQQVLIVAADSLLTAPTLAALQKSMRLRDERNSNGFMPGEGAGALLVGPAQQQELCCTGIGFGIEKAHVESDQPLRADGLRQAMAQALSAGQTDMGQCELRMTDLSGEHYYFKEAALALARLHRGGSSEEADLWHPAECIGECGAAAGVAMLAVLDSAHRKGYLPATHTLAHWSNDNGARAAVLLQSSRGGRV